MEETLSSSSNSCTQMLIHFLDQKGDNGMAMMSLVEGYIGHCSGSYYSLSFHEQQDILQEVAIKLLRHGEPLRAHCTKSWVYTVVRNQCINYVRDRTRQLAAQRNLKQDRLSGNVVGSLPLFYDDADNLLLEDVDCLERVFTQVESQPTGKADIHLYTLYAFGFSYAEISERANRTVNMVGKRITILKKRIKAFIHEYC